MPTSRTILRALAFCTLLTCARSAVADPLWGSSWNWTTFGAEPGGEGNFAPGGSGATAFPTFGDPASGGTGATGVSSTALAPSSSSTPTGSVSGSSAPPTSTADAYINFTAGPYPEAGGLTSGGAQAWYFSPVVERLFGGVPTNQQQADFTSQVLKDVNQTFALSGLSPVVTTNSATPANHTISVVSNAAYNPNPSAAGITDVGHNGFAFMDKLSATASETDLEWSLAHVLSHELMHAFGVAVHHDQTGSYLDTASATWSLLTSPSTVFSPAAVQDILAHNYGRPSAAGTLDAAQASGDAIIQAQPVPEPATISLWSALGAASWLARRRRAARG